MKKYLCDIKLVCDEKIFECHKNVLSCQSDVFEAMFKEKSTYNESKSGVMKIEDFDADVVESMVYFMYHENVLDEKMANSDFATGSNY